MLNDLDIALLDFERAWTLGGGPKDRMIEFTLGLTADAYYRRLRRLVFDPAARSYDPLTTRRIARMIEADGHRVAVG